MSIAAKNHLGVGKMLDSGRLRVGGSEQRSPQGVIFIDAGMSDWANRASIIKKSQGAQNGSY
jgi:hypothetical protein